MNTHQQVGKTFANWIPNFANWIQLADICQLEFQDIQPLASSWQLAMPTELANLPTAVSHCRHSVFGRIPVGENSPSYYVGEGTTVPSSLRGSPGDLGGPDHGGLNSANILALDLGTQTGWATRTRDGAVVSGSQCFRPHRFEGGGMRYLRFKRWLTEIKQSVSDLDAVFFEEVRRHAGVDAAHAYGGFMAHLTAWCEHHQIPYQGVPVGTIKKHATGKGNAGKDLMIAAALSRGHAPADDNEADALALLHWAIATQEG